MTLLLPRWLGAAVLVTALAAAPSVAHAQAADSSNIAEYTLQMVQHFSQVIEASLVQTVRSPDYYRFALLLFIAGLVFVVSNFAIQWFRLGLEAIQEEAFESILLVIVTSVLFFSYGEWTKAFNDATLGVSQIIQQGMTGRTDTFYPVSRLMHAAVTIDYTIPYGFWDIVKAPFVFIAAIVLSIQLLAMYVVVCGIWMWAFWGYSVMKVVGLLFVPMLFFRPLAGWFDSWFRTFAAFGFMNILVTISLNIAANAFYVALGYPNMNSTPMSHPIVINTGWEVAPLILFGMVSLWGMFQCISLANAITGGAAAGTNIMRAVQLVSGASRGGGKK
jgi:hypothetical protein